MPTTAIGTEWDYVETTLPNGDQALLAGANTVRLGSEPAPLMVYVHGNFGPYNQFLTQTGWATIREWIIDHGWVWCEGRGGGSQWGSPRGVTAYEQLVQWASTVVTPSVKLGLLRSMGGCYARSFVDSPIIAADAVIFNSGVLNLLQRGTEGQGDSPAIWSAFQVSSQAEFEAAITDVDPLQAPASTWADTGVLNMWGSADTTVPPALHAELWETAYSQQTELYANDIRPGGDHSQSNGSYVQWEAMSQFMAQYGGTEPPVVEPGITYQALAQFMKLGDRQMPVLTAV